MHVRVDADGNYADEVEIYQITAPNGKSYIGQSNCFRRTGGTHKWRKKGLSGRWREHRTLAAKKEGGCSALYASLRKYGPENFHTKVLARVQKAQADDCEATFIQTLQTLSPNGLNLLARGEPHHFSSETRRKMGGRKSIFTPETRAKISSGLREAYRAKPRTLPLYVRYARNPGPCLSEGYRACVKHQGKLFSKGFMSTSHSMQQKLHLAVEARDALLNKLGLPAVA